MFRVREMWRRYDPMFRNPWPGPLSPWSWPVYVPLTGPGFLASAIYPFCGGLKKTLLSCDKYHCWGMTSHCTSCHHSTCHRSKACVPESVLPGMGPVELVMQYNAWGYEPPLPTSWRLPPSPSVSTSSHPSLASAPLPKS